VAEVFPELVQYDAEGKPFTVYYHLLTPLLLRELQKEHQQNVAQQTELAGFQQKDAARQAELVSLRQQLVGQQQKQATEMAALQLKLNQLDKLVQASHAEIRLSQK
jgi:septal ring factor EnvC (AmiA/AmiB activator)